MAKNGTGGKHEENDARSERMHTVSFRLAGSTIEEVEKHCASHDESKSEFFRRAVEETLASDEIEEHFGHESRRVAYLLKTIGLPRCRRISGRPQPHLAAFPAKHRPDAPRSSSSHPIAGMLRMA